jgi:hypothetical protein
MTVGWNFLELRGDVDAFDDTDAYDKRCLESIKRKNRCELEKTNKYCGWGRRAHLSEKTYRVASQVK